MQNSDLELIAAVLVGPPDAELVALEARIRAVLLHKTFEHTPRQVLQKTVKDAIVVPHGVEPLLVSRIICRCPKPSRINAMHPVQKNLNRTAVGQARA